MRDAVRLETGVTIMSRAELIDTIVRIEWEDFLHVNNEGGVASCQRRPDTFKIMRTSLFADLFGRASRVVS